MIEIQTDHFAGNEALHAFPAGKGQQPLPCVVFYHGFTSSKLVYSYFAVALAQAGFRVIMKAHIKYYFDTTMQGFANVNHSFPFAPFCHLSRDKVVPGPGRLLCCALL